MMRSTVFRPTPEIPLRAALSSRATTSASSAAERCERIAIASLGPMEFTVSSARNAALSSAVSKPKSVSASSRACVCT